MRSALTLVRQLSGTPAHPARLITATEATAASRFSITSRSFRYGIRGPGVVRPGAGVDARLTLGCFADLAGLGQFVFHARRLGVEETRRVHLRFQFGQVVHGRASRTA